LENLSLLQLVKLNMSQCKISLQSTSTYLCQCLTSLLSAADQTGGVQALTNPHSTALSWL